MNKNKKGQFTLDGWIKDEKATLNKVEYINTLYFYINPSRWTSFLLQPSLSPKHTHTHTIGDDKATLNKVFNLSTIYFEF